MNNLEGMDKLLEMYNLPILNQKEIENMNRPITSNEIESVIIITVIIKTSIKQKSRMKTGSQLSANK